MSATINLASAGSDLVGYLEDWISRGRIVTVMREAGFTQVEKRPVATPFGPMVREIGCR
ncbi:hypothetical protein [Blastochloris viridis]|uniref:Uncharacterized protein n=1 Tax=Blastochloris viridis TaxID=1079 RepID=A0A0H5BAB5_BLAVI|nr:hypothetical protein [Blastochloris viridis]ALK10897.1 hypothetical protein BVIR_3138 [Blastochloris viridis]BAR99125.1 hypothetical protein BV133_1532 [Blastochloris viridis]CUU43559.1 hypothetical protein BVIRIDIS_25820 [Blastochloris viridis]